MIITPSLRCACALAMLITLALSTHASAQAPPRFYWKNLSGGNAIPVIYMDMSGNANPVDPAQVVIPDSSFDANIALGGYARTFTLFNRSALAAVLQPVGRISGDASIFGRTFRETAKGFGDPTLEFVINVVGPPSIKNIPDAIRYEPGFSLDLLADLIVPIGEYDDDELLNLGLNRWYGRIAAPVVWQLGPWVPGRRTTLEILPSVWIFGDNDDFVGHKLSTDPKFQVEAHLTRDFHKDIWGSVDVNWVTEGKTSIDGSGGEDLDMLGLGFTLGFQINENIQLTAGYLTSINDSGSTDLQMDIFKLSLVFGWHPRVEGMKRLSND